MSELSERHEIRVRGRGQTIVFVADSADGRLVIRQEPDDAAASDVCTLTLKDPEELRAFFTGLRRIVSSLGYSGEAGAVPAAARPGAPADSTAAPSSRANGAPPPNRALSGGTPEQEREAIISQARQRNPQAFTPWTPQEEQEVRRRFEEGESIPSIARARKRSQRAIELRLQRMGVL